MWSGGGQEGEDQRNIYERCTELQTRALKQPIYFPSEEMKNKGKPQSIIRVNNDVAIMMVETGV